MFERKGLARTFVKELFIKLPLWKCVTLCFLKGVSQPLFRISLNLHFSNSKEFSNFFQQTAQVALRREVSNRPEEKLSRRGEKGGKYYIGAG